MGNFGEGNWLREVSAGKKKKKKRGKRRRAGEVSLFH